ncbi:hypothetical protein GCM10010909_03670 [Acidocella aquatica]|uniref:Uncharacterized protein n=1 Tax=Acidocella aquatica TaxID=1922313 RepID=A0ABQ6A0H8_9PROT|nr:hypothetical protein [Acidocella aquatica]GLR65689.1 hypothetical protein GCM10010909_03670 [Acidocella aquatica]
MLTDLDESLHHQAPLTFDHVNTTDHRFYDRQLMGGFRPDGEAAFLAGITYFKNMNVAEGFMMVQARSAKQYNVRFTKQLRPLTESRAQLGPLSLTVVEPFKELRFVLEAGVDYPLAMDITYRAVLPARLEHPHNDRMDGRLHTDYLRYNQLAKISGWIEVEGERFDAADWFGWRDHSWGVRPGVGGFEPQTGTAVGGGVASASRTGGKGLFLVHAGFFNGTQGGSIQLIEAGDGKRIYTEGAVCGADGEEIAVTSITHDVVFKPGTRVFDTMGLDLGLANGETWTLRAKSVGRPWVYRGGGFDSGFNDGKGQGVYRSKELMIETEVYDISDPELIGFPDGTRGKTKHREQMAVCEINGVTGSAYMPMFVIGDLVQLKGQK